MKKKWLLLLILAAMIVISFVGCQIETFTVEFDTDGGSAIVSLKAEKGKEIECPEEPEKSGYRFDGWYKNEERTEMFDFSSEKINGNITLFAKWIKVFAVEFDTNGGSNVSTEFVDSGSVAVQPAEPFKDGKNFGGWYKEKECINKFYFNEPIMSDMTLFAKWVDKVTYTVNFYVGNYDGQHEWSLWNTQTVEHGYAADTPESPDATWYIPEEHMTYSFLCWESDFDDIRSDLDVYAVYQIDLDEFGFSGGYGTESDPWEIASVYDLEDMAEKIASDAVSESGVKYAEGYYIQTDNIFVKQSIRLIGDGVDFEGVYDGQNHGIFFLTDINHGIFGINKGLIRNLGFLLSITDNDEATGALTTENLGTIKNCNVLEHINISGSTIGSSVITEEQATALLRFYGNKSYVRLDNASWFTVINHEVASIEDCNVGKSIDGNGEGYIIAFTNFGTIKNIKENNGNMSVFECGGGAVKDNYGVIENVKVGAISSGGEFAAGIALCNHEGALIKNCSSKEVDFKSLPDGYGAVGGAVVINKGKIINSAAVTVGIRYAKQSACVAVENYGIIDECLGYEAFGRDIAAGIVLYARDGSITANCSFASIWGSSAAGIAYLVEEGAVVKNCSNAQDRPYINYLSEDDFGNALGAGTVGGIASKNYGTVEDCRLYTWTMSTTNAPARYSPFLTVAYCFKGNGISGGVVGENYGILRRCDTGATVFGAESAGGIVGVNEGGLIEYCTFVASAAVVAESGVAGGAVGIMNEGTIRRTYCNIFEGFSILRLSSYFVNASEAAGGFIGKATNAKISECYTVDRFGSSIYSSLNRIGAFIGEVGGGCLAENCFYVGEMTNAIVSVNLTDGTVFDESGIKNLTLGSARNLDECGFGDVVWSVNEKNNDGLPLLAGKAAVFTWLDKLTQEEILKFLEEDCKTCGNPVLEGIEDWSDEEKRILKSEINTYFKYKDISTSSYSCFDSLSQYLIYSCQKSFRLKYWNVVEALLYFREPETTDFNLYPEGWINETDKDDLKYYLLSGAYNLEGKANIGKLHFTDELAEFLAEQIDAFVEGEQTLSQWLESKVAQRYGESSEELKVLRIWFKSHKPGSYVAPSEGNWADLSLQEFMEFLVDGSWKNYPQFEDAAEAGFNDFVEQIINQYDVFAEAFDGNILFGEFLQNWVNDNFVEGSAEREWWNTLKNFRYQYVKLSDYLKENVLKKYGEESEQYWALINEILNPEFRGYVDCDTDVSGFVAWIEDDSGWYSWSDSSLRESEFVEIRALLVQWVNEFSS